MAANIAPFLLNEIYKSKQMWLLATFCMYCMLSCSRVLNYPQLFFTFHFGGRYCLAVNSFFLTQLALQVPILPWTADAL